MERVGWCCGVKYKGFGGGICGGEGLRRRDCVVIF